MTLVKYSVFTTLLTLAITTNPVFAKPTFSTNGNFAPNSEINLLAQNRQGNPNNPNRGGRMGERGERFLERLNLTEQQKQQIQAIRQKYQPRIDPLRQSLRTNQQQLQQMMAGSTSDVDLKRKHQEISNLRNQMANLNFESMLEIRQILTAEQRQQLGQMMQQHRQKFDDLDDDL